MNDPQADHAARLDDLEIRLAHQDRMLAELNEVITAQWNKINLLDRQVARLTDELQNMTPAREGPEPPPPHY